MRPLSEAENILIYIVLAIAFAGLIYAGLLARQILAEGKGSAKMQQMWGYIRTGANAYLRSQFRIIAVLIVVLCVLLFFSVYVVNPTPYAIERFCPEIAEQAKTTVNEEAISENIRARNTNISTGELLVSENELTLLTTNAIVYEEESAIVRAGVGQIEGIAACEAARTTTAIGRAGAFLMGAIFSAVVGFIGMNMAVQGSVRTAAAAVDTTRGYASALRIAYRSGTITGMLTDGLGLFGGTIIFILFGIASPDALLGFGFGGTLLALFMRVGGGIFTKAADVGADLVGKVESDLPEDDPRNAAVIADLVGDNVGDCAGMAADIFESYEVTIVSGLILGLALSTVTGSPIWIIFPLVVRGIGVLSSIISTYLVRTTPTESTGKAALKAITRGFYSAALISGVMFTIFTVFYMRDPEINSGQIVWQPLAAVIVGVLLAIIIDRVTAYFTDTEHPPVKDIARNTQTGPATTVLSGLASGMESSTWAILVIAGSILASVVIFGLFPITNAAGVQIIDTFTAVLYGVAMTGIGMLTLTGNNVSMDAFGPISDNAQGIAELSGESGGEGGKTLEALDAVGNTTKAITKGVAIGSAVIAAVSLFGSFLTDTRVVQLGLGVPLEQTVYGTGINIASPIVFIGFLIGGGLIFLFSALLIRSVNRAAFKMINIVRRQLKVPGVMEGTVTPDYNEAVSASTQAAQRELLPLGVIAVLTPIVVGFLLGATALGGFLAGIILAGQLMAVFMSNAGGAWDNAKKYIEEGHYGGKRSEPHKAAVVGDTIGDPFKDTAGPALNPMIKVVNLVSLLVAPLVVTVAAQAETNWAVIIGSLVLVVIIVLAILRSKREDDESKAAAEAVVQATGAGD
jgi:K(+)-stimulated pyrophosphate-energized sodium pump